MFQFAVLPFAKGFLASGSSSPVTLLSLLREDLRGLVLTVVRLLKNRLCAQSVRENQQSIFAIQWFLQREMGAICEKCHMKYCARPAGLVSSLGVHEPHMTCMESSSLSCISGPEVFRWNCRAFNREAYRRRSIW